MKSLTFKNVNSVIAITASNAPVKVTTGFFLAIYSFLLDPINTKLYMGIAILIMFDFVTAIFATFKTKEKITSSRASRTLVKLVVYGILASASVLVDRFILEQGQIFADLVLGFIAVTEFISILENIGKMGYVIPTKMLEKLKSIRDSK